MSHYEIPRPLPAAIRLGVCCLGMLLFATSAWAGHAWAGHAWAGRAWAGGTCDPGSTAEPASFHTTVRPALAEDINPAKDVVEVFLTAQESVWGFGLETGTPVWTYNGVLPGPTIEAEVGDTLVVHLCNALPEPTTIHWHGVETPANMDGSHISQLTVPPGGTFRYEFPLIHAGTFWYHPHVRTNVAVERGLYGLLIVRDSAEDQELGLPQPEREHWIALDDIQLDPDGQIRDPFVGTREEVALEMLNGREGTLLLTNGMAEPTLTLEQNVPHRMRILNAASSRFLRLSIPDHPFWRIGGDQGLIESPIRIEPAASTTELTRHPSDPDPTTGLLLTPGERADILFVPQPSEGGGALHFEWHDFPRGRHSVDFNDDGTVTLAHDVPDGTRSSALFGVIQLFGDSQGTPFEPPSTLRTLEPIDAAGAPVLKLTLGHTIPNWETGEVTAFIQGIGKPFARLGPADIYTTEVNKTYIWEVKNLTGSHHNFHTHGWSFQHLSTEFVDMTDPNNPDLNYVEEATHLENKDTFLIRRRPSPNPGQAFSITRFAVTFDDEGREGQVAAGGFEPTETESGGWLAHCHLLEHSARGMMTLFQVTDLFADGFESGDLSAWSNSSP